eukprot:2235220-Amphidinium_carterae.1
MPVCGGSALTCLPLTKSELPDYSNTVTPVMVAYPRQRFNGTVLLMEQSNAKSCLDRAFLLGVVSSPTSWVSAWRHQSPSMQQRDHFFLQNAFTASWRSKVEGTSSICSGTASGHVERLVACAQPQA